jgi:hypothetical protein
MTLAWNRETSADGCGRATTGDVLLHFDDALDADARRRLTAWAASPNGDAVGGEILARPRPP